MATPPTGFILPSDRTKAQEAAHIAAMSGLRNFTMPGYVDPPKGFKLMLTDFWRDPAVIADIGQEFTGYGQFTGACVGVSEGNAMNTANFVQCVISPTPTKAFLIWWPHPYGRTRYNEGDRGQGEGAVDSIMGDTLVKEGFYDITQPGLPVFSRHDADGFWLSKTLELQWSDGGRIDPKWIALAKPQAGLTKTIITDTQGIRASVINGYPILNGCAKYVGHGSIVAGGGSPYVRGQYDGNGGHSTCILGVWNHPNDGWLYLYSNQWPTSTYPKDPAGAGRCCVWIPESQMANLFRLGGNNGETMSLSNIPGQPAQPKVADYTP